MQLQAFLNRVKKNRKKLSPFVQRHSLTCYRFYNRDMPEFPLTAELYGSHIVLSVYARDPEFWTHFSVCLQELAGVFGVCDENVFVRFRERQKGASQYQRQSEDAVIDTVTENGLKYEINLTQYLDVGLFLDHRVMRRWAKGHALGRRCLNLFCYTGSMSVALLGGEAQHVDSVDMSRTYLSWLERNLKLNFGEESGHIASALVQADVTGWLRDLSPSSLPKYDFIFVDPPSFSNSKRMRGTFDVARDHPWMLRKIFQLLKDDGVVLFSNNRKGFQLAPETSECGVFSRELSQLTNGLDFQSRPAHTSFALSPAERSLERFVRELRAERDH